MNFSYARIAADGYEFDGEDHTGNFDSVSCMYKHFVVFKILSVFV